VIASPLLPLSPQELQALHAIATLPGARRVVALPDLHIKPRLETPSSLATALDSRIVLDLSSPSPGCGMALALLPLQEAEMQPASLDRFFELIARALPLARPPGEALVTDIRPHLLEGARAAVEHFDLDPAILGRIEGGGNALPDAGEGADPQEMLDQLPAAVFELARREFGTIGSGNHFLELQVVDEILDPAVALQWGVREGQAAVLFHADSGRMGALAGRLYAYRRKNNRRGRLVEMRVKLPFHLRRSGSPAGFARRLEAFFLPRMHAALPA
jgi:tRNA-splicing ligase RtcB